MLVRSFGRLLSWGTVAVVAVAGVAAPSASSAALARKQVNGTAPLASYSGTLSRNSVIRQQQLICDPPEPIRGSTSVEYEPDKVSLSGFAYGPGYGPLVVNQRSVIGYVEVEQNTERFLQDLDSFLVQPEGRETGYVQVLYSLVDTAGQITPGGTILDEDPGLGDPGEGVDTHQFTFTEAAATLPGKVGIEGIIVRGPATYHIYADDGSRGADADFLVGLDDAGAPFTVTHEGIHDATVTAPEPSGLIVLGLGAMGLLARRRRQ
jgi:hypothetical protein